MKAGTLLVLTGRRPEKVTNGTFDTATTGWTAHNLTGSVATLSIVSGRLRIANNAAGGRGAAYQTIATAVGTFYRGRITGYEGDSGSPSLQLRIGTSAGDFTNGVVALVNGEPTPFTFTATSATTTLTIDNIIETAGKYIEFDNISVR